jgi:mannitol-1-phosphate 5-dehydrogenase
LKKIVVFGAGNIGRSLVGQLFSRAGYEVVFVDVDNEIVQAMNKRKAYTIEVKDKHPETIRVENVRAIHLEDQNKVIDEIVSADIMSTAVGVNNLQGVYPCIARGLAKRAELGKGPVDIIICENIKDSSSVFSEGLTKYLPKKYRLDSMAGLVETCIGKMVPIMSEMDRRKDPLLVYAEAYNTIILDEKGFKCGVPKVDGIEPKNNITAYVDRKLFIHNMGHAATAYLGYLTDPDMKYVWEAIGNKQIHESVEEAMRESGEALVLEYADEFNNENIHEHIKNLIERFSNRSLGDTIFRVGRDVPRKLSRNDRLIGALLLDEKNSVPAPFTTLIVPAAMHFRGKDDEGKLDPWDEAFANEVFPLGIGHILRAICGLDNDIEALLIRNIKKAYEKITNEPKNWFNAVA